MRLNFKAFVLPQDISHKRFQTLDIREAFANIVYKCGDGVAALSLATKIYESDGETEYSPREVELMQRMAEAGGKPVLIDGIRMAVKKETEQRGETLNGQGG